MVHSVGLVSLALGAGSGGVSVALACGMLGLVSLGVVLWGWCGASGGSGHRQVRLLALLIGFALGMGVVLVAGDAVLLFVGWEVIGVVSVLLVG